MTVVTVFHYMGNELRVERDSSIDAGRVACLLEAAVALESAADPDSVARFLSAYPNGCDPVTFGAYLGQPANEPVLRAYAALFDVQSVPFMVAWRAYLRSFRPIGDALAIDRYVDAWVAHYLATCTRDERRWFTEQSLFSLCYATIMLNVDLHSPVLADVPRMTRAQFVKNVKGVPDGAALPDAFLEDVYEDIRAREFGHPPPGQ